MVLAANVAHKSSGEVFGRGEYAAGDDVTLDLGEPDLDLVEPSGVGSRSGGVVYDAGGAEFMWEVSV